MEQGYYEKKGNVASRNIAFFLNCYLKTNLNSY